MKDYHDAPVQSRNNSYNNLQSPIYQISPDMDLYLFYAMNGSHKA